jgi:hypothetical protein
MDISLFLTRDAEKNP